jgi:hypothetical protein
VKVLVGGDWFGAVGYEWPAWIRGRSASSRMLASRVIAAQTHIAAQAPAAFGSITPSPTSQELSNARSRRL